MDSATTRLIDPSNPKAAPKKFTYDFSYWSHDGFKVRQDGYHEKNTDKYVDQVRIVSVGFCLCLGVVLASFVIQFTKRRLV